MFQRVLCRLRGHKIDLFPEFPAGVSPIAYFCACGHQWVSREQRDAEVDAFLDRMTAA